MRRVSTTTTAAALGSVFSSMASSSSSSPVLKVSTATAVTSFQQTKATATATTTTVSSQLIAQRREMFGFGASEDLKMTVIKEGSGPTPPNGSHVQVHYTGWLMKPDGSKGSKFDSSVDRGEKFVFRLGAGEVIKGWDLTCAKLKKGDKVEVQLPPHLAYGSRGAGGVIPPNATLIFEIELFGWR